MDTIYVVFLVGLLLKNWLALSIIVASKLGLGLKCVAAVVMTIGYYAWISMLLCRWNFLHLQKHGGFTVGGMP